MGLDAVEILMDVEEEFGISIEDEEVWYLRTLGGVHDYLLEKCGVRKREDCPTRTVFYRLRQAMGRVLDVDPKSLTPETEILSLLGRRRRGRMWQRIGEESGLELPKLKDGTDAGVLWGAMVTGGIGFLVATILLRNPCVGATMALLAMVPGLLIGFVVGALCLRPVPYPIDRTLGGLARNVAALNHEQFPPEDAPPTEDDPIWERLCAVMVKQLGVKRETLHRGTRFVEDLGV